MAVFCLVCLMKRFSNNANQTNEVVLYDSSMGFLGDVTIPGLDFVLAIPANIQFTGQFTSTVTYTLS